jgi:hypothetical protein
MMSEVVFAADFFPQLGVLSQKMDLLLLHQHAVRDVEENGARVIPGRGGLGPPLDPHRLANVFAAKFENDAARLGPASDRLKRIAQRFFGVAKKPSARYAQAA